MREKKSVGEESSESAGERREVAGARQARGSMRWAGSREQVDPAHVVSVQDVTSDVRDRLHLQFSSLFDCGYYIQQEYLKLFVITPSHW